MNYNILKSPDYIDDARGVGITAVRCKCCGAEIRGMVDNPQSERAERNGDKVIIRKSAMLTSHSNYREIELRFKDNGRHITGICAGCLKKLDRETAEEMYQADLARFRRGGMNTETLEQRELVDKDFYSVLEA